MGIKPGSLVAVNDSPVGSLYLVVEEHSDAIVKLQFAISRGKLSRPCPFIKKHLRAPTYEQMAAPNNAATVQHWREINSKGDAPITHIRGVI